MGSWSEIAEHYWTDGKARDSASLRALGDLAEHIHLKHAEDSLFGWTSLWDLCIAQRDNQERPNPRMDWLPYLRLSPDETQDMVCFRYVDSLVERQLWTRVEPPEAVIARFERFLDQMRWKPAVASLSQTSGSPSAT